MPSLLADSLIFKLTMSHRKSSPLEKVLGRLDDLDATNLAILVQRLARERKLLETIFNVVHEGILVIDQNGVIEYANEAAGKLIGFDSRNLGKTVLWKLVPDLARTLDLSSEGAFHEVSGASRELHLTYPENRYVRLYLLPFIEGKTRDSRKNLRYVVILSDITEEKMSTQDQIENEKVSSIIMLAAGVAHELGNPLNSLTIHLQLMKRELKKLEENESLAKIEKSLAVCSSEVERLDGIIANFLEAVRPHPPDFQDLDVLSILEEVLEILGQELKNHQILVEIEASGSLPVISADRNQIKQVYFNVLKNACEAMESGGSIKVRTRSDDEFVFVQIGDSGTGIEQSDFTRVFEPYFSTKKKGLGLGMMIVQRIMREHGGQLGIDSQVGVGTVVTLQFPQKHRRIRLLEK